MKTLLIATVSIILILIMGLSAEVPTIEEQAEEQLVESEMLQDSAMIILKELHDKNDSLLTKYFDE
jgi:hypothetical protein